MSISGFDWLFVKCCGEILKNFRLSLFVDFAVLRY